jgi:hypothetical protein
VLLAENRVGYHNLIKLVSSGYTEGFYYKPRIDKDLLAQHAEGLIGLSSCLKGEVATGIRTEQQQKAVQAAAAYRDILGRATSSSRCSTRASTSSASSTPASCRSRGISGCRSSRPTTCTTWRTPITSRTTSCCASARASPSTTPNACGITATSST